MCFAALKLPRVYRIPTLLYRKVARHFFLQVGALFDVGLHLHLTNRYMQRGESVLSWSW